MCNSVTDTFMHSINGKFWTWWCGSRIGLVVRTNPCGILEVKHCAVSLTSQGALNPTASGKRNTANSAEILNGGSKVILFNWLIIIPIKDRFGLSTVVHWLNIVLHKKQRKSSSASVRLWIFCWGRCIFMIPSWVALDRGIGVVLLWGKAVHYVR